MKQEQAVADAVREFRIGLTWAGAIIALALGASFARHQGYIDHDTMLRLVIGANGPLICFIGNRAPKVVVPNAGARYLSRFAGWAVVLSGIVYTLLWAFAPIATAVTLGSAVVIAAGLATLAFWLRLRGRAHAK